MNSLLASTRSLLEMFDGKLQEFGDNVDSTHMVWLEEIQQEANRMFSSDFNAEPELMPKTPSQKKRSRRKRVSVGHNENRSTRRFSKGTRSNLRISSVQTLKLISEDNNDLGASSLQEETAEEKPKRNTRRNNRQKQSEEMEPGEVKPPKCSMQKAIHMICLEQREDGPDDLQSNSLGQARACLDAQNPEGMSQQEAPVVQATSFSPQPHSMICTPPEKLVAVVRISAAERVSADRQEKLSPQCRTASKLAIARPLEIPALAPSHRRSSVRHSLTLRRSLAGLRHSMTQESVRRASRRSFLKKKARMSSSTCSSSTSGVCVEMDEEKAEDGMHNVLAEHPAEIETDLVDQKVGEDVTITDPSDSEGIRRVTRSMAQTIPSPPQRTKKDHILGCESSTSLESDDIGRKPAVVSSSLRSCPSVKRRAVEAAEELSSPRKKLTPPKKSHSVIRPNMKSFLHTVQKNQLLMMTPGSLSRSTVVKSFIKHTTPLRVDLKERERLRLEALKKKQEQEIERKKKLEEEKRRKQEEMKRKRDVRLRKVVEARVKEEQREEEKKKKIEQKLAHMEEKNDKLRVERLAEEKAKKKVATKRQEELEQRKRQDEETRRRKILQAEEEKKQQELLMKRRAEDELERARRLAEARRALELKKEQEREREKDQEREREKDQERAREKDQEREQERERELLRQQQAAAEREREKALALQRELVKAAREKEQREAEERKRREEMQRQVEQERAAAVAAAARNVVTVEIQKSTMMTPVGKAAVLNETIDVERSSPQSYEITPKGGSKTLLVSANPEDYGMDQNSDDSTDDESAPRKPIPSWAEGQQLQQAMLNQYFNPVDVDSYFGEIEEPKLEQIFNKSKPRYFKRTSSAVWQSPPRMGHTAF